MLNGQLRLAAALVLILPAGCRATAQQAVTPPSAPSAVASVAGSPVSVTFPQWPSLSPDGTLMVFAWAGDLWAAPTQGGAATRITSHPGDDRRSAFAPDGKSIAFESTREGGRNLFVMPIERAGGVITTGPIKRVTLTDRPLSLAGFTPDGQSLLFYASLEPSMYRGNRMYKVALAGGAPERVGGGAFGYMERLSPDGSTLYFTRGRPDFNRPKYEGSGSTDLWKQDVKTGAFSRVTSAPKIDADAYPLPDGSIVFISSRDGQNNVYRLPAGADDSKAVQLTKFAPKAGEMTIAHGVRDLSVSADGKTAVFLVWDTLYRLDLTKADAQPTPVSVTASADSADLDFQKLNLAREVSEAAISPDGKSLAVVARGEVFVRSTDEGRPTRRVTFTPGRERGLAWSPDNRVLYFASDEGGTSQLYYATVALSRDDLTPEGEKKAEEPEKKDDAKGDEPKKGEAEAKKDAEPKKEADAPKADDAGKADGAKADEAKKDDKPKKPAKKKIDYAKRWSESLRFDIHPLTPAGLAPGKNDGVLGAEFRSPVPSPDGKKLLFTRGLGDLVLMDLATRNCRVLFDGWNEAEVQWASDSRHIVFAREDEDFNSDVWLLDTTGADAKPVNITRHPDNDDSPRLSADGKVLYFRSERAGENFDYSVYAVFLDRKLEGLRPYELEEYFKKAGDAAKKRKPIDPVLWDAAAEDKPAAEKAEKGDKADEPAGEKKPAAKPAKEPEGLKFDLDDAYLRVRRITNYPGSVGNLQATPGGERIVFSGPGDLGATEGSLYSLSYKGDDRKVIQAGNVGGVGLSLVGDRVTFVRQGQVSSAPLAGGKVDSLAIDAPVVIDIAKQQRQKFNEASRLMGNNFYNIKGLDWKALSSRYATLAEKTRTNDEFDRVFTMVLGELDGSHTGITGPAGYSAPPIAMGYLGVDGTPTDKGYKITRVIRESPADKAPAKLEAGDVITAVDGQSAAGARFDLATLLAGKAGKEILVEVERAKPAPDKAARFIMAPTTAGDDVDLRYKHDVQERAALVEKLSGGKLGYLHIRGMSEPSVRDFERDLYACAHGKQGLLIDVRDNGGGSTADILLSSLTAPNHTYTVPRGADAATMPRDAYPRDRRLIYGYNRPISVLINENSFSNAEIFAHAIKTIKRGTLVGTATFGGVISTGAATLIDGTTVRQPFRGWYLPDGRDLENNGAKPDIDVAQTPESEATGTDPQLEAAVKELLQRSAKK
jgi:tricorn protease